MVDSIVSAASVIAAAIAVGFAGVGPGIGISKRKKNGFNTSIKIASNNSQINNESTHFISQIGITKSVFGGTITNNLNDNFNSYGLAAYYKPTNFPSISASIEYKDGDSVNKIKNWVLSFQKNLHKNSIGIAVGTYNEEEEIAYEGWSEIVFTDKMKIIPVIFARDNINSSPELGFSINTKFSY